MQMHAQLPLRSDWTTMDGSVQKSLGFVSKYNASLSVCVCFHPYLISSFLSLSDDLSAAEFFSVAVVRFFFFFDRRDDDFRLDCSLRSSSFPASSSSDEEENPSPSLFVVEGNILPLREDLDGWNGRDDDMVAVFMRWKLWAKGDIHQSS